jgi:hypothetical protein
MANQALIYPFNTACGTTESKCLVTEVLEAAWFAPECGVLCEGCLLIAEYPREAERLESLGGSVLRFLLGTMLLVFHFYLPPKDAEDRKFQSVFPSLIGAVSRSN